MSLQVWLPLTQDLRQQGLSNIVVTNNGATYSSTGGKLGGCYSFDGSDDYLQLTLANVITSNNSFSVSVWVNITSGNSYYPVFQFGTGTPNSSVAGLSLHGALCNRLEGSDGNSHTIDTTISPGITAATWTHITLTYSGSELKYYINGALVKTITWSYGFGSQSTIKIADFWGQNFKGKMNDFRLYDHCLSPMEVKELAKGLVLHYPLNRQGWGQENLLKEKPFSGGNRWTSIMDGRGVKIDWTSNAGDTYFYLNLGTGVTLTEGKTYTLSFLCSGLGSSPVSFYWCNLSGNSTMGGVLKNGLNSFTFAMPSANITNPFFDDINRDTTLNNLQMWNFKLEEGNKATPWCPNSADTLATTMGLNGTTEYDCSGFCNNGTRTGTFTWTSNTPKYAVSQIFNGTDNAIQTPSLPTMITDKNYTIAVWIYKTVIGSKGYQTIYGGPSGFEIEARNGSANETKFVPWNWGKPMASYELNEWNHCVFVHSDADCKIYLNGEYIATGTAKASNPTGNYFVGAWDTATQQNFDGLMSDFRIYATALSADDVLSLYQNSAYIDSSGNVYGTIHEV